MPPLAFPSIAAALALASLLWGPGPAAAQEPAPPKPYKKVSVTLPAPVVDPSLDAFRKQLGDIVQRKDRAALTLLIAPKGFFWERESGNGADDKKSGIDNFAAAIELDAKDGSGWEFLADYATEPTASQVGDRKDLVCSPANPIFGEDEFLAVVKATDTDPGEWGFPLKDGIEARETAKPDSPVVERLGMHFVRVMRDDGPPETPEPTLRIVTPSGKVAFISPDTLSPLGLDQLCYLKQGDAWKITGYVGEGGTQ
jgi:hypothetical protein